MRLLTIALLLTSLAAGCSGSGENILDLVPLPDPDSSSADSSDTGVLPDSGRGIDAVGGDELPPFDSGSDVPFIECEPGSGCFLDLCDDNTDCQSGFCVEHMGEAVCSITCTEECAPGWTCKLVTESDPDVLYICVSDYSNLCKPCSISSDCKSYGGADDACIDYGEEGSFCGGSCDYDSDCPWGFACKEVNSVDGVPLTQCFAEAGVCPCTAKSAEKGLFTPCVMANESGSCQGKRVCTEEGLTECDAGTPAQEQCNGLDDDCDGEIDEPALVDGKYVDQCNDDNDCTVDTCAGEAGCAYESLSEGECVDGDACTIADHCEGGVCMGLPIACDDGNPCTDDLCDGMGGCKGEFNHADCDDEDPCTVADSCDQGECSGFAVDCDCLADADCAELEDDNVCNGTLFCDTSQVPYSCAVAEDSLVICPEPQDGGSICVQVGCNPDSGECTQVPAHEGFACDDSDPCTVGDVCGNGECLPGVAALCNDVNPCTTDICMPGEGCVHMDSNGACSDGNVCTTDDACEDGECTGGPLLDCQDANPCTSDFCDPDLGCIHEPGAGDCDDGNACTEGDHCAGGLCVGGAGVECDDGNVCTKDSCSPVTGCTFVIHAGACDDGDACTINDSCINGVCTPGMQLDCNDGNPCTADSCSDSGTCLHSPMAGACDDGNECTIGEQCEGGQCVAAESLDCDDGNECTTDACDPLGGCVHSLNTAPCDDNDPCTFNDSCVNGACAPGPQLDCDDGNPCTADSCLDAGACDHAPVDGACDDGNECTIGEQCDAGKCAGGEAMLCDDGNVCTTDSCDPVEGCLFSTNTNPCDDGDVCTLSDHCHLGECISSATLTCNDNNLCTDDACKPLTGCEFAPNNAPCDDGNVCTEVDTCSGGFCSGGAPSPCDDTNICTDDLCDDSQGCMHFPNNEICNDFDACTANEFCSGGECGGGVPIVCDDQNMCTDNSCDPDSGCIYPANSVPCNDGDECTDGDQCSGGECASGAPVDCDDSNVCTTDSCEVADGCHYVPVADDTPCGVELWCKAGQCVPTLQCPAAVGNKKVFTSSTSWEIPGDVDHVRIVVVGGGGGGAKGHGNGAGSGHVRKGEYDVAPCDTIQITVGSGGTYEHSGATSSFGGLKTATGGSPGYQNSSGSGAGGSGGGGAGNAGCGGDGGTGGSNGQNGCTYSAGAGGNFDNVLGGFFVHASMSHGQGGAKGTSSHAGGGGGGGLLIDGQGTGGGDGAYSWSAKGGKGYGGGGGGGGYNGPYADGGTGGKGVVYVEWD